MQRQKIIDGLPGEDRVFEGQSVHDDSSLAPISLEYFPAVQSLQCSGPRTSLNFPAIQRTHEPPFGPVLPALHLHICDDELPRGEEEDSGQSVQVLLEMAPSSVENFASAQSKHSVVPRRYENFPAAQALQAVAPNAGENVPWAQYKHVASPGTSLNLPGSHLVHFPPSGPDDPALQ